MNVSDLMQAMADAGAPMEAIIIAVRALEAKDAILDAKRAVERDRKRKQRGTVTGQSRDTGGTVPNNPSPLSPPLKFPPDPLQITPPLTPHPNKSGCANGTRLPEDWQPKQLVGKTAEMVSTWPAGMMERELAKFRDHFLKTPGARGRSLDWNASLRNWLRTADERKSRSFGNGQSTGGSKTADAIAILAARGEWG